MTQFIKFKYSGNSIKHNNIMIYKIVDDEVRFLARNGIWTISYLKIDDVPGSVKWVEFV